MVKQPYDAKTGEFKRLYETVGFLVVRDSPEEVFLNYSFDEKKLKILYSHYRRKIPNSFSRTIFYRLRTMIGSREVEGESLKIFFPSMPLLTGQRISTVI